MWVEPDLNMPDGESLVRQLLVGKRWYKQAYGVDVRIGWNPDSFGYNWQLPQIYKKSGVDYFVTQKMEWNDTNQLPFKLFWWQSPDGSKVLAYFPHGYGNEDLRPLRLSDDLVAARQRSTGMTDMMDLYGVGDHGGGPTRAMLDQGFHWADPDPASVTANGGAPDTPHYEFGTAQSWFSAVEKQIAPDSPVWNYQSIAKGYTAPAAVAGKTAIPTWNSELYFEYHRGIMTTQAMHKHNMRTAEEEMLNAEKWSSLAWLDGLKYPADELTEDWKKVLFNQFHDLAAGSGIAVIYKDAQKDYDWVRMSADGIDANALQAVQDRIDTRNELKFENAIPVVIWNPLGWERSGDVTVSAKDPTGKAETFAWTYNEKSKEVNSAQLVERDAATSVIRVKISGVSVPALGYRVIYLIPATHENEPLVSVSESSTGAYVLNNETLFVSIDKDSGCITSIFEKTKKFEELFPGSCGNQLQFFKDTPKQYDAWNIDPGTLDVPPATIERADSIEQLKLSNGDNAYRITRHWQNSKFVQTISLSYRSDQIDIDNDIDWHEKHVLLKAAFPLAVTSDFATYEIPYGEIERPTTRNNSFEKAQFEVPAMRWADLSRRWTRRKGPRPEHSQPGQVRLRRRGQRAAHYAAALADVARSRRRPGRASLPLRALSARGHVEGRADGAPRMGVRLSAAGRGDDGARGFAAAGALVRFGLARQRCPDRREESRRRERADFPRVRVGREGDDGRVSCASGRDRRDRHESHGAARRRAACCCGRRSQSAHPSVRDSDDSRGLSEGRE